jgi:hypothetical protein
MNITKVTGALTAIVLQLVNVVAQAPAHGVREFTESGSFEVPAGVTTIKIEMWGGGGGGGGGAAAGGFGSGGGGGGGGSGAYLRTVISVTPGHVYTLSLGDAGRGGTGEGNSVRRAELGADGGETSIRLASRVVLAAAGGVGGKGAAPRHSKGAAGGTAGTVISDRISILARPATTAPRGTRGGLPRVTLLRRVAPAVRR